MTAVVREGLVPVTTLGESAIRVGPHQVLGEQILFCVPGLARVLLSPDTVDVEPDPGASSADVAWLLGGHVRSAQRILAGSLSLWAAAVVMDGCAVGIVGGESSGKSAVAGALALHGCGVLSDAALPVELRAGQPVALAGGDGLQLWPDTLTQLELAADQGELVREGLAKRTHRFSAATDAPLGAVVCLVRSAEVDAPAVDVVRGGEALELLGAATVMLALARAAGLTGQHFLWASRIAAEAKVLRVRSSRLRSDVVAVAEAVAEALRA